MADVLFWIVGSIVGLLMSCLIGQLIGRCRGEQSFGGALGLLLGPFGWLIAALLPDKRLRCPRCGVLLWSDAHRCPSCALQLFNKGNSVMMKPEIEQDLQAAADRYATERSAKAK